MDKGIYRFVMSVPFLSVMSSRIFESYRIDDHHPHEMFPQERTITLVAIRTDIAFSDLAVVFVGRCPIPMSYRTAKDVLGEVAS